MFGSLQDGQLSEGSKQKYVDMIKTVVGRYDFTTLKNWEDSELVKALDARFLEVDHEVGVPSMYYLTTLSAKCSGSIR